MQSPLAVSLLASAVLLAACAAPSKPRSADTAPPDLSTLGAPVRAAPAGAAGPEAGQAERQPVSGGWSKPGASREQRAADREACYRFAKARVANDIRIDDDISAARDQPNSYQSRFGSLTRRVDGHYYSRQRGTRFEDCMQSKGYSRG